MSDQSIENLRVFAFPGAWGLPTTGPFALKLEAWLRLADVAYERVYEGNPRKGPKGKNTWIELDGARIGDTGIIIGLLGRRAGIDLDAHLSDTQRATALALTRMVEEHLHQVLEYELFLEPSGFSQIQGVVRQSLPAMVAPMVARMMRKHFAKQLHARGIARHDPREIARQGCQDLDAIASLLGEQRWLFGDRPCVADCAVFGQIAPLVFSPMDTPVAQYAKSLTNLAAWCRQVRGDLFDAS